SDSNFSYNILQDLSSLHANSEVFVNYTKGDDNIEIHKGSTWHLNYFHNRPDITLTYLDNSSLCTKEQRYILDRSAVRLLPTEAIQKVSSHIKSGTMLYQPINIDFILPSIIQGQRHPNWSDKHEYSYSIYSQHPNSCIAI